MQLFKIANNFPRPMYWILDLQKIRDHWPNTFIVLWKYCLENWKI